MIRKGNVLTLCLALMVPPGAIAAGSTPSQVSAITGTFNCASTDSDGRSWRFHSVNKAWGAFVRADTVFPPQNGQPADYASTYVGYDGGSKTWNIVSVDMDGTYFTRSSSAQTLNGSHWIDRYPADGATAILLTDNRGYRFNLTRKDNGGTSDTTCRRT